MPWGLWSSNLGSEDPKDEKNIRNKPSPETALSPDATLPASFWSPSTRERSKTGPISWNDSLNRIDWEHYKEPRHWVPSLLVAAGAVGLYRFHRSYLKRIPSTDYIQPGFFRRRSLLGRVTRVGDGDNFHLFHTPGGILTGWGWLRKVPTNRKELKGRTIPIRIAGVDAPEAAHFGQPGQPFAAEALAFLQGYILNKRVRAYIYRRDQYDRVVATVYVRQPPLFLRRDVGLEMLRRGWARTYEGKTQAEFGGAEQRYHAAQETARRKGKGMWAAEKTGGFFGLGGTRKDIESPGQYKARMRAGLEKPDKDEAAGGPAK